MSDITVRIGAETGGVEAGAARAEGAIEGFGQTVQKTRAAARAFAQEVGRAFQAPASNIGTEAQRAAAGMDRAKGAAQGAAREARDLQRDLRGVAPAAGQAAAQLDRASASANRFERSSNGVRGAVTGLITVLSLLGVRQVTQEFQDAAFAQFGFESALSATTGGLRNASAELAFVEDKAADLGLVLQDSVSGFVALTGATKGTALQGQTTRDIWEGLMTAGVAMNRSNEQLKRGQEGVNQIASKGVVSMEEIRQQLAEAIPGAVQIGARAMDMTTQKFVETVAAGKMLSEDFLPKFAAQLKREFGPSLEVAMNTPLGRARRELAEFSNATFKAKQAAGRGFLSEMTIGLRELNQELSSPDGLKTAARLGETLGEAFTAAARGVIFLADNLDKVVMGAQLLAGGMLIRWLVVSAAEARTAAIAYAVKGAAARAAAANATAGAATEAAANLGLRASLQAVALAEVQKAQAAGVAAAAQVAEAQATVAATRAQLTATATGLTYAQRKAALVAANQALVVAEGAAAAAALRLSAAQGVATASTTAMASAMALARGAGAGLLALVGGPWGAAFLAAGAAVYFLWQRQAEADRKAAELSKSIEEQTRQLAAAAEASKVLGRESGGLASEQDIGIVAAAKLTGETDKLADAHYRAAAAAKAHALAEIDAAIAIARTNLTEASAAYGQRREQSVRRSRGPREPGSGAAAGGAALAGLDLEAQNQRTADAVMRGSPEAAQRSAAQRNLAELERQRKAEAERKLETFIETPAGGDGGGGAGSGSGSKGPGRVATWQNDLDAMLVAQQNFFGESTSTELAFWESKRAMTEAGSEDRMQVDRKIFQLRRSIAQDELRAELEDLQTKQQMAQGDFAEQMRLQDLILARLAETYGEDSREYQRALQDKVRLQQAAADEQLRIEMDRLDAQARAAQAAADADEAIAQANLENELANLDLLADLGLISVQERGAQRRELAAELRDIERQAAEEQFRIQKGLLESQLALENIRPEERRRLNAELAALEIEHAQRMRVITAEQAKGAADDVRDAMREAAEAWRSAAGVIGQGAGDLLNNAVTGAKSFGEVWQGIGDSALNAITSAISRMVENWITAQFAMTAAEGAGETARTGIKAASLGADVALTTAKTGVHLTGEGVKTGATAVGVGARTGIEAAGAATSIGLSASVALADVANSAVRAAAGAYAAIAGIPIIGPILAPVTAAVALGAVLALGKSIFSARGGAERVANDGDMYELHRDEMVLPASIATPLRSAIPRMTVGPVGQAMSKGLAGGAQARAEADEARSNGGGFGPLSAEFNISALDGQSVKRVLKKAAPDIVDALLAEARRFNVRPAGG